MRIHNLYIAEDKLIKKNGLKEINLKKLGQVVALVGRNGSGKSRILNTIVEGSLLDFDFAKLWRGDVTNKNPPIASFFPKTYVEYEILKRNHASAVDSVQKSNAFQALRQHSVSFGIDDSVYEKKKNDLRDKIRESIINVDIEDIKKLQNIAGAKVADFEDLVNNIKDSKNGNEFSIIKNTALKHLSTLPHLLVHEYDEALIREDKESFYESIPYKNYLNLADKISTFLRKEILWKRKISKSEVTELSIKNEKQGFWELDGHPFNYSELSAGQKTLFIYALLFYLLEFNSSVPIRNSIILMDEPELNLHPDSEIQLINSIREMIGDSGQLWIATHSLNIISSLNYEDIYIVKDGAILDKSKTSPTDAINELLDLNSNFERMKHFFSSIDQWAYANFTTQCFKNPDTISTTDKKDPQFTVFKQALNDLSTVKLLDFGAGSGRIYKTIQEDGLLKSKIEYHALEIFPDSIAELDKLGVNIETSITTISSNKYDVVLMSNVLHEVLISDWEETLNVLINSLNEKGFLIVLEDLELPKGEQIEEAGFLIMSKEELGILFGLGKDALRIDLEDVKYRERISCCVIAKSEAKIVTKESIIASLEKLKENSFSVYSANKHTKTTSAKEQHHLGRKLALYSQLYLNAESGIRLAKRDFIKLEEPSKN